MSASMENIGGLIKVVAGSRPLDTAAATVTGLVIDRAGFNSAVCHIALGAASGTPDAFTVNMKVQHGDASDGSDAADYKPDGSNTAAITALTTDNAEAQLDVKLGAAKRYIKLVPVVAFTAGTSPKIEVATSIVLGGAVTPPVA